MLSIFIPPGPVLTPKSNAPSLGEALFAARDRAEVSLVVGGKTLRAHRQVLTSTSSVFRSMLSSEMQEAGSETISLPATNPASVLDLLRFMYTRDLSAVRDWPGLIALASMYDVLDLESLCVDSMAEILRSEAPTPPTLVQITGFMVVAFVHGKPALHKECLSALSRSAEGSPGSLDTQGLEQWLAALRLDCYAAGPRADSESSPPSSDPGQPLAVAATASPASESAPPRA
jgi:hypothetical protein